MKAKKITINCERTEKSGIPYFSIFEVHGTDASNNVVVVGRYLNRESAEETADMWRNLCDKDPNGTIYTCLWVMEQLVFIR